MTIHKSIRFAAPYRSATFNDGPQNLLSGRNGVVSGGSVTTSGGIVTIQPLVFIQQGLLVTSDGTLSTSAPLSIPAPYFVAVTSSSSIESPIEVITPTFVKRPEDMSAGTVLIAEWDGQEWRALPRIQLDGVIKAAQDRAVNQDLFGISDGMDVTSVPGVSVTVGTGSLIDRQGAHVTKKQSQTLSVVASDADGLGRIDEVFFRRPDDDATRIGTTQYIVGQTYDSTDAVVFSHQTQLGNTAKVNTVSKTLVNPTTNAHYFFFIEDYGDRAVLKFRSTPDAMTSVTSAVTITSGLSSFDATFNQSGSIDLVYIRNKRPYYKSVDTTGTVINAETPIGATDTVVLSNPKILTVRNGSSYYIHVIYEREVSVSEHTLYYARVTSAGSIDLAPTLLVSLSAIITNPSIDKDDDDALILLAFENATTQRVYLRTYDISGAIPTQYGTTVELQDDTFLISTSTVMGVSGASNPIVKRAANKDTFVFWKHFKGSGLYGVACYSRRFLAKFGHKAVIPDLTTAGENISKFYADIDALGAGHFIVQVGTTLKKASIRLDTMAALGATGTVASSTTVSGLHLVFNSRGALVHKWDVLTSGYSNNGTAATVNFFGPGTYLAVEAIASNEFVILDSDFLGLTDVPTVGDQIDITSPSNTGTYNYLSSRTFVIGLTTYRAVATSVPAFTSESSGSAQFREQNGTNTYFVKSTAGISSNLRGFYLTPTDIYIAHYRTLDSVLAVSGTSIEEDTVIRRLYEYWNLFAGSSGQISWSIAGPNKLVLLSSVTIGFFNRTGTYTIASNGPSGVTVLANQVVYVEIPDDDTSATLTLKIQDFGKGLLDRYGKKAFPLFWNVGGNLYMRFAPYRLSSGGETIIMGDQISEQMLNWLGASTSTPDATNHGYTSTTYILQGDSPISAISKLDAEAGALNTDRNMKLVRGGTWTWNSGTGTLSWSAAAAIQIPGLAESVNSITAGSVILSTNGDVAYVEVNRTGPGGALTVSVAAIASLVTTANTLIIARRVNTDILIGSHSMLLISGESKELDSGLSIQNRTFLGITDESSTSPAWNTSLSAPLRTIPSDSSTVTTAVATIDKEIDKFFGQFRVKPHPTLVNRVTITGVDLTMLDNAVLSQTISNLIISFTGAQIDFTTGNVYQSDGVTPLGVNFTPFSIPSSQYFWYSLNVVPSAATGTNAISIQFVVIPASAANASAASAPFAAFASNSKSIGEVLVQNVGGTITVTTIRQLGVGSGSGSGGAGDVTNIQDRMNIKLSDSRYELATIADFKVDGTNLTTSATATYDIANTRYKFTAAAQNLISINLLDANEFSTQGVDCTEAELDAFWFTSDADKAATYELSRDGGNNYYTVSMARLGTTDNFNGRVVFSPEESSFATLHTYAFSNADTTLDFTGSSSGQARSQAFVVASGETEKTFQFQLNKVGSPSGSVTFQIIKDDGTGKPSLLVQDLVAASAPVLASSLSSGTNAYTFNLTQSLAPATYHMVAVTDATYKASYSVGVASLGIRSDASAPTAPVSNQYNGSVWAAATSAIVYIITGRTLDLRLKITSSATTNWEDPTEAILTGFAVSYNPTISNIASSVDALEVIQINGNSNTSTFTLTKFLPDPRFLRIYLAETGQVFKYGAFSLNGYQVVFPANTFNSANTIYTLHFDQLVGGGFDNSDANASLLAANHLGSTDPNIDRSVAGLGIFLRRPDGVLREIVIDNNDQIVIYSV